VGLQPEPHRQILGELCFSWYALAEGESKYRRLPVAMTLGPDLARPLHAVWEVIETHAAALDRLCVQQTRVTFEVVDGNEGKALVANLPLAEKGTSIRLMMEKSEVHYFVQQHGALSAVDPDEEAVDRAVYLIFAELARRKGGTRERARS
jgi:hypothetical protein